MTFMAQRFPKLQDQWHVRMSLLWLKTRRRALRAFAQVKGEVAVTAGFVSFKVSGFPVVEKAVFPSPFEWLSAVTLFG